MVIVFAALTFILTVLWVLFLEYWGRLVTNPDKQSRLDIVRTELGRDKSIINRFRKK